MAQRGMENLSLSACEKAKLANNHMSGFEGRPIIPAGVYILWPLPTVHGQPYEGFLIQNQPTKLPPHSWPTEM